MKGDQAWLIGWVIAAAGLTAAEIAVPGFVLLPFGIGAAAAAVANLLGAAVWLQVLLFFVVSISALIALRPVAARLNKRQDPVGVGANRLVHRKGIALSELTAHDPGMVRLDREEWSAFPLDHPIAAGTPIVVVQVKGTRVIVKPR